jgi:hypothetical protein
MDSGGEEERVSEGLHHPRIWSLLITVSAKGVAQFDQNVTKEWERSRSNATLPGQWMKSPAQAGDS